MLPAIYYLSKLLPCPRLVGRCFPYNCPLPESGCRQVMVITSAGEEADKNRRVYIREGEVNKLVLYKLGLGVGSKSRSMGL